MQLHFLRVFKLEHGFLESSLTSTFYSSRGSCRLRRQRRLPRSLGRKRLAKIPHRLLSRGHRCRLLLWLLGYVHPFLTLMRSISSDYVPDSCGFINLQCGYDSGVDGGTWRIDISTAQGPAGEQAYYNCLGKTRSDWIMNTGCRTG